MEVAKQIHGSILWCSQVGGERGKEGACNGRCISSVFFLKAWQGMVVAGQKLPSPLTAEPKQTYLLGSERARHREGGSRTRLALGRGVDSCVGIQHHMQRRQTEMVLVSHPALKKQPLYLFSAEKDEVWGFFWHTVSIVRGHGTLPAPFPVSVNSAIISFFFYGGNISLTT